MTENKLVVWDEKWLSQVSTSVETADEARDVITKLEKELSRHEGAVGLSAIQIGIPKRVFILNGPHGFLHFINPEIVEPEEEIIFLGEGCLSFPGEFHDTKRYRQFLLINHTIVGGSLVEYKSQYYYAQNGEYSYTQDGVIPIAVQHEFDHLNGIVFRSKAIKREPIKAEVKIGRNDPCPCGKLGANGKHLKYKKCCGA